MLERSSRITVLVSGCCLTKAKEQTFVPELLIPLVGVIRRKDEGGCRAFVLVRGIVLEEEESPCELD